jgi:energy-coupling factor transport system substrate-specific component
MSWVLASFLLLGLALAVGFGWYERTHPSARVLALVATLAALAALGRIAFAPLPNVKPTTDIVLIAGYVLGGAPGFAVGAVSALASNLFFGQGPWTPWQMVGWGVAGLLGAGLARVAGRELGRVALALACGAAALVFGAIQNLSLWVMYSGDHTWAKLEYYFATSFAFDVAHTAGSVVFCLAFGPALVRALQRYRMRFEVSWRPAPAAAGLAVALVALAIALPAATADAKPPAASVRYLERAQNADGGFGPAPGAGSTQMHTGWTALGLAAAGRNPLDVERGGKSVIDYMRANAGRLRGDLGERSRTILALRSAGVPPTRLGGRDLLGELVREQQPDGSFQGFVNTTAFAVLALRAAGRPASDRAVRAGARFIASQANPDGGFNFGGKGGPSGADDTGAALQALAAAGRRDSKVVRRAARWLAGSQNPDGGFSLQRGASNAQSTAWAVQGLIAAGRDPARVRRGGARSPLAYLRSLVGSDGAIRYSRTSTQTPVWVTAQAVTALAGKALPLAPTPRKRRATAAAPTPTATATPEPAEPPGQAERAERAAPDDDGAPAAPAPAPALATAPLEAVPATVTPLRIVALTFPAVTPALGRLAGLAAAVVVRTWLPR